VPPGIAAVVIVSEVNKSFCFFSKKALSFFALALQPGCLSKQLFFEKKNQKTFIHHPGIMIGAGH